eukprot:TRINITY_DN3543_c0_g1_i1.p1 TRINITY_DN3543_c0_g1~~TRINITY_DN3543_c0_g1_i1.p1  ORF type:complete len:104 (+),score=8.80 TRINITY_DN3543_c0_g1_i1:232-543(+)
MSVALAQILIRSELSWANQVAEELVGWVLRSRATQKYVSTDCTEVICCPGPHKGTWGKPKFFSPKMTSFQNSGHVELLNIASTAVRKLFWKSEGLAQSFNPAT